MKVSVFAPYGSKSPEVGLLYLVANFLRDKGAAITQLRCNGAFSQCDRDAEIGWKRTVSSCLTCMHDQKRSCEWALLKVDELTKYINTDEITASMRWVNSVPANELMESSIEGKPVADFISGSIAFRFGIPAIDPRNKNHEAFTRRLMLATIRMLDASRRYYKSAGSDLVLIAGQQSFMSRCMLHEAHSAKIPTYAFVPDFTRRCITIHSANSASSYDCPLLIEEISELRPDVKSWGPELIRLLNDLIAYLGVQVTTVSANAAN